MNSSGQVDSQHPAILGLEYQVETPENVRLSYELAGPGIRGLAYGLDCVIRGGLLSIASIVVACMGLPQYFGLEGISTGGFLLLLFFFEWGYFVVCEGLGNGRTIGKAAFGLRVIQSNGTPLTFSSALTRNLIRAADAFPLYGPGFFTMLLTRNFERMGDLAASTIVIRERLVRLPRQPVIVERIAPLSRDEINRYVPDDQILNVIDEFLGRRHVLNHDRGHQLAAILADDLAVRLQFRGNRDQLENFPMAFLARVFVTFHSRESIDSPTVTPASDKPVGKSRRRPTPSRRSRNG